MLRSLFFYSVLNSNTLPVKVAKQYGFHFHYTFTFFLLFKYLYMHFNQQGHDAMVYVIFYIFSLLII